MGDDLPRERSSYNELSDESKQFRMTSLID